MSFSEILNQVHQNLSQIFKNENYPEIPFSVEPAKKGFGDVSSNAPFLLAKHLKKKPFDISQEIATKYVQYLGKLVSKVEAHPSGYLNFYANFESLNEIILKNSQTPEYGSVDLGKGNPIVVEHTSVNPNKALHIGHIRNIVIGDTISRILQKVNYDVKILNYVDDSGLQVADIIVGFRHLGFSETPPENMKFDHYCGDEVYVKTTEKYEKDSSLEEIRKNILKEIEEGNSEIAQFADSLTKKVLACQLETCWNLSVTYDCLNFESQIIRSGLWQTIFEKLKQQKMIEYDEEGKNSGCWVIRGDGKEEDKVIVRSNGTATYIAKDIPYAAWKLGLLDDPFNYKLYELEQPGKRKLWQTTLDETTEPKQNFTASKVITVIDSRQSRLQKIVTTLMSKFKSDPNAYVHLGYESVTLSSQTASSLGIDTQGKQTQMSGRKGLYVNADSVLDLLKSKTLDETKKRNSQLDAKSLEKISHNLSVATIRYEMIKQDLDKIITFDLTKSLSLEGDTAPYIQYANARATSILEKSQTTPNFDAKYASLDTDFEKNLVKIIGMFELQVRDAASNLSPKVIARYCYDLAVIFNAFYEHVKVLDSDEYDLVNARLCLVKSFKDTLAKALDLLGISSPERM